MVIAAWATPNAIRGDTHKQIKYLVRVHKAIVWSLLCPDPRIVTFCLEGLETIIKVGEADESLGHTDINLFSQVIDKVDGLGQIENPQSHDIAEIHEKTAKIHETYWNAFYSVK